MNFRFQLSAIAIALFVSVHAIASLHDIRTDRLPKDASVRQAYSDVLGVEDMVSAWSNKWEFPTPKERVVVVVKTAMDRLSNSVSSAPENAELVLLTGLVAHYAYNLDVEGSWDLAVKSLDKAHQLDPSDYRPQWFLANHRCQSMAFNEGMKAFLSVENSTAWDKLPADYWNDYAYCAMVTGMPEHVLRAVDRSSKLDPAPSRMRDFMAETAHKRMKPSSSSASYPMREAWYVKEIDSEVVLTSSLCGIRFHAPNKWKSKFIDVNNATCIYPLQTAPTRGKAGDVFPNIVVLVHQAGKGESLEQFIKTATHAKGLNPMTPLACPAQPCSAFENVSPSMYGKEGDGHLLVTAFERPEPQYPGISYEEPSGPPTDKSKEGDVKYYRAPEQWQRFDGTLYYLVMLDSAESVLLEAKQDYESFLKTIQIE